MAQLNAFQGAEGFAADATGGRGGTVIHVTNLNDSGTGSFRDAVSHTNRIVVFDVGGYINLSSAVSVSSNITIAGQTAPGDGIGFTGAEVSFANSSNDIVRYVRFRPGDGAPFSDDGVSLYQSSNIILDHVSIQFASWNNIDAVGASNITVQNSIIANPIGQQFGAHTEGGPFTWANNVWANAHNRQPLAKADTQFVNNVVYNYQAAYTAGNSAGTNSHDILNNYFITGPATGTASNDFYQVSTNDSIYASGNKLDSNKDGVLNGSTSTPSGVTALSAPWSSSTAALPLLSAAGAYTYDIANAGASLQRDAVDALVISQIQTLGSGTTGTGAGTAGPAGGLYTHQSQTGLGNGGFGTLSDGTHITDTNNNGIADAWETAHGLTLGDAAGYQKLNPLGYIMLEQYINELADANITTRTWTNNGGNWSTATSNWTGAVTPSAFEKAVVAGTGSANGLVTITQSVPTAARLSIGSNGPAAGEKVIVTSGALTVFDTITVGDQNNATLQIDGGTVSAANVVLGNTVSGTTYTGTLLLNGGTLLVGQVVLGGGSPGSWTAGGAWTWSGGTLKANATLTVSSPASIGNGGAFVDTNGFDGTMSGVLGGVGSVTKLGSGALTVSAANTYSGATTIGGGAVVVASLVNGGTASALGASSNAASNLVLDGGTLKHTGAATGTDRLFTLTVNGGALDSSGSGSFNFTNLGAIALSGTGDRTLNLTGTGFYTSTLSSGLGDPSGGETSLLKDGAGRWFLGGTAKTYSGDTMVNAGTLELGASNVLPFGAGKGNVAIATGAALNLFNNSVSMNGLSGAGNLDPNGTGTRSLTLGYGDAGGTFTGNITGAANFSVNKVGVGTQILGGTNTFGKGGTISGGVLQFNSAPSMGGGASANITVQAGATAAAGYAIDQPFLSRLVATSTGTAALAADSANNLDFSGAGANLAAASLGAVGNATYTGTLTPFGTTYRLGGGTGTLTLSNASALTGTRDVQIVSGGAVAITNTNDFTGVTTIGLGGTLIVPSLANGGTTSALGQSSNAASNLVLDGGVLKHTGATTGTDRLFTLTPNGGTLDSSGSGAFNFTNLSTIVTTGTGDRTLYLTGSTVSTSTLSSGLGDPAGGVTSLAKFGAGRWFLGGTAKTYSGDTTINAGTLQLGVANVLPFGAGKGNLIIAAGASLNLFNNNAIINGLSGAGNVDPNGSGTRSLTLGNGDANGTFTGNVTGGSLFSLNKVGTGTQLLGGTESYGGATTVRAGTLVINGAVAGAVTAGDTANPATPARLMGNGSVGNVTLGAAANNTGAVLDPGSDSNLTGTLSTKNFTATSGAHLSLQLGGSSAGLGTNGDGTNGYDSLNVTGTVTLGGADLQLALVNNFGNNLHLGDKFFIIVNDGTDAVSGIFADGSTISAGSDQFSINYTDNADSGTVANDVSLTVTAVPEPNAWMLLLGTAALCVTTLRQRERSGY